MEEEHVLLFFRSVCLLEDNARIRVDQMEFLG